MDQRDRISMGLLFICCFIFIVLQGKDITTLQQQVQELQDRDINTMAEPKGE